MITEIELVEMVIEHFDEMDRESFLEYVNYVLDTDYIIEDIDWGTH